MNRSLQNVILGGYEQKAPSADKKQIEEVKTHTEIDSHGAVESLTSAQSVIIVPGYGLAVANA